MAIRFGHPKQTISSGFAGLLFAMHACSRVSVYGYDLTGHHPGHYFNDATEGIVARLQEQVIQEPHRMNSLSVDPGIEGVQLRSTRLGRSHHAEHAAEYRSFIEKQYTGTSNATTSHPYLLERGLTQILVEAGCVRLRR
uniref:Uncharacterized protein n=1 Tax=Haptolina ericina TaxID=156174 RepID=A0A7S3F6V3_9EUKA|mmetsp:Transcript_55305/g.123638  ORF Transcript_55305/g.123638 Transcript_55305/m.123638 type:complete len:139 (+) Transcript_55305:444-860(+)